MTKSKREIRKLAIANRGEVAVRIHRACEELGIKSVLLHSEVDVQSRPFRLCDETQLIGPGPSSESYLSIERNIRAAKVAGADAIHPGFGFLSENAEFASECEKAGLIFVGPSPDSIRLFGDKVSAKQLVEKLGIPTIPGYEGDDQSPKSLIEQCKKIGFPVIVKAAAGGGGRGMKVIENEAHALTQIESAQREALAAFGSPKIFIEKYLNRAKHIEFQIFGLANGQALQLHERECSVQRRHQKIIEEALSADLSPELKSSMAKAAVEIVQEARYQGAGTIEFLVQDGKYYFIEMNTRLQVEHPVTEMVLNLDLVKAQILTAQGVVMPWRQEQLIPKGHAIECRIYAEDPYRGGIPSTGKLGSCRWPDGYGRRFEVGFEAGDEISSFYDSMIAKVIVWDEDRPRALVKMLKTLEDTVVFGLKTNIPFLKEIISHPEFADGTMTTRFIETHFPKGLSPKELPQVVSKFGHLALPVVKGRAGLSSSVGTQQIDSPYLGQWRNV